MTYTYATLPVSQACYEEVETKLKAAGYDHSFKPHAEHGTVIDMHGIALRQEDSMDETGGDPRRA